MSTKTFTLPAHGITCTSCVGHVQRALNRVDGVKAARVNLASERATINGLLLNPIFAAAAVAFSSVFVVSNSLRLRGFRPTTAVV